METKSKRPRRLFFILTMLGCLSIVLLVAGFILVPMFFNHYIDGYSIDQASRNAKIREILWENPDLIQGKLNEDTECYEPSISSDGLTMIFTLGKAGDNADLFLSNYESGGWSDPEPLTNLNSIYDELGPELSRDGEYLYFYSNRPGGFGGYDIWVSRIRDNCWSPPENIGQEINSGFNEYGPGLSPDSDRLFFSSNRLRRELTKEEKAAWKGTLRESFPGTDYDIFHAYAVEQDQPAPVDITLQPTPRFKKAERVDILNSPADDGQVAITPRGDFIYFASNRNGGLGRFDLYRSRFLYDELNEPENMGAPVNSRLDDMDPSLIYEGHGLLFSSNRNQTVKGQPSFRLYKSISREVLIKKDFSGISALFRAIEKMKWALLIMLLSLLALLWLLRYFILQNQGLHASLLQKCLLASILLHMLLALLTSSWIVTSSLYDLAGEETGELCLDVDTLSEDKISLDIREDLAQMESLSDPIPVEIEQSDTLLSMVELDPIKANEPVFEPHEMSKSTAPVAFEDYIPVKEQVDLQKLNSHVKNITSPDDKSPEITMENFDPSPGRTPEPDLLDDNMKPHKAENKLTVNLDMIHSDPQIPDTQYNDNASPEISPFSSEESDNNNTPIENLEVAEASLIPAEIIEIPQIDQRVMEKPDAKKVLENKKLQPLSSPSPTARKEEQKNIDFRKPEKSPSERFNEDPSLVKNGNSLLAEQKPPPSYDTDTIEELADVNTRIESTVPDSKPAIELETPKDTKRAVAKKNIPALKEENQVVVRDKEIFKYANKSKPIKLIDPEIDQLDEPAEIPVATRIIKTAIPDSQESPQLTKLETPDFDFKKLITHSQPDLEQPPQKTKLESFKGENRKKANQSAKKFNIKDNPLKKRPIPLSIAFDDPSIEKSSIVSSEPPSTPAPMLDLAPLDVRDKADKDVARYAHDVPRTYHGLEMSSRKVIFCLDVSLSMEWNNRIGDARQELIRLIDTLDKSVEFNIITFSGRIKSWSKNGLQKGTVANRKSAKGFVQKARISSDGTNTVGALQKAFSDDNVESIFFLSDGHPTEGFTTNSDEILKWVKRQQKNRHLVINTIAYIKGPPPRSYRNSVPPMGKLKELMRRLAEENNGNYVLFDSVHEGVPR